MTEATPGTDILSVFRAPASETDGVLVDVEHPTTGEVLMRFRIARFGGKNNAAIVREERKVKAKLPPGQRRQIEAGGGDPEVIQRMNRQVFVRTSLLGWELVHPSLQHLGEFSHEKADKLLEEQDRLYDLLSDKATDEATFATEAVEEALGNSQTTSGGSSPTPDA